MTKHVLIICILLFSSFTPSGKAHINFDPSLIDDETTLTVNAFLGNFVPSGEEYLFVYHIYYGPSGEGETVATLERISPSPYSSASSSDLEEADTTLQTLNSLGSPGSTD